MNAPLPSCPAAGSLPVCLLDERLLALTGHLMIWDLPPAQRRLNFALVSGEVLTLEAPWPRLLLCALMLRGGETQMRLMAVRRRGRLSPATPLFHAPLMNLGDQGRLMPGLESLPDRIDPRHIDRWERALGETTFSHVAHPRTVRLEDMRPGAQISTYHHIRFWRQLARSQAQRFPGRALVPCRHNLGQWLSALDQETSSIKKGKLI